MQCSENSHQIISIKTNKTHTHTHLYIYTYCMPYRKKFIHDYEFDGILFKQTHVDIKFNDFAALH